MELEGAAELIALSTIQSRGGSESRTRYAEPPRNRPEQGAESNQMGDFDDSVDSFICIAKRSH